MIGGRVEISNTQPFTRTMNKELQMTSTEAYEPVRDGYDLPELEDLNVFADEIRIGDYYGGFEVTQVSKAAHYSAPAVRLTLETDPEHREVQDEVGRLVLITDRARCHPVPIQRPV